jgi:D-alanyl-lipoteichoic acid acyltransferase DltB (MBOAT superfamily)
VAASLILNLSILFFFKYFDFTIDSLNALLVHLNFQLNHPNFDVLLPVGISFYTFQALGYTIDVYRGDIYPEKDFISYALFVSFFPQLVAGPIERSKNLLKQLEVPQRANFDKLREGLLLMIWGFFLKIVLADRIAMFVDAVYGADYENFGGVYVVVATVLFAVQIYCDFAGYSTIAMGTAKMLGVELMENFNTPYLSMNCGEFWRRWHISLSTWFRDYVYIPLGGNRKGKARKYLNLMITFGVSGLWHGANWTYVIWGLLNGGYQVIGDIIKPARQKLIALLGLNPNSLGHKLARVLITFVLIDISWVFFRAQSVQAAVYMLRSTIYFHPWNLLDGSLYNVALDSANFTLMLMCIAVLMFADIMKYKGVCIRQVIAKQDYWFQAVVIAVSISAILLFGIWGSGYNASNFIYFQF